MAKKLTTTHVFSETFLANHAFLTSEIDKLYSVLNALRHEGRPQLGKNLRRLNESTRFLHDGLAKIMDYEEKCLFPFIGTHIPRFQPLIFLLCSEHEDFRRLLLDLQSALAALKRQKEAAHQFRVIQRIEEKGAYLVCLLRSHLWAEDKKIFDAARQELRKGEKEKLIQQILGYHKQRTDQRISKSGKNSSSLRSVPCDKI